MQSAFSTFMNEQANWLRATRYGCKSQGILTTYDAFSIQDGYKNYVDMFLEEMPLHYILHLNTTKQEYRLHYQSQPASIMFPEQFSEFECVSFIDEYHVPQSYYEMADDSYDYINCNKTCLKCYAIKAGLEHILFDNSDSADSQATIRLPIRDHRHSFYVKHRNYRYLHDDLNEEDLYWCKNCFKPLFKTWAFKEGTRSDQIYPDRNNFLFHSYVSNNATYHLFPTMVTDSARVSCYGKLFFSIQCLWIISLSFIILFHPIALHLCFQYHLGFVIGVCSRHIWTKAIALTAPAYA